VIAEILSMAAQFDDEQEPFAIKSPDGQRLGTLHWGQSALSVRIRWMPYLELMIMALFFLIIMWALQSRKEAEQTALFAGMAKETAHQMGTPLTSIMGWIALLEEKVGPDTDLMRELNRDVDRLGMVSTRFSQIGSLPKLEDTDLTGVVDDTIEYFRRRLPHLGGRVQLRREGHVSNAVAFNRDLLGWVFENLIKNGIDALADGKGTITVRIEDREDGGVMVAVIDTGRGIPGGVGNRIFEPGFTTKQRGWGMGLALVKRIVVQYHRGRIRIVDTGPGGTSIAVTLPPAGS
jgi:signal transduction histidine kinase